MKNYFVFKNKPALVTLWIMEPAYAGMKADSRRKKNKKKKDKTNTSTGMAITGYCKYARTTQRHGNKFDKLFENY